MNTNTKNKNYNEEVMSKIAEKFESKYIAVDIKGRIGFQIQNGPIKEFGVNGCQIDEIGKVWLSIVKHFNAKFPCRENSITITKIEEALMWQNKRKHDREKRNVEGKDKL